tara:strand:+ start:1590 stop:3269 length:1680 start_codon:yes stop_codon:yes gene_type:complete
MNNNSIIRLISYGEGSRLCGNFKLLRNKGRFKENVYYNSKNRLYLYKARSNIYVLGKRKGGRVVEGYTSNKLDDSGWFVRSLRSPKPWKPQYDYDKSLTFVSIQEKVDPLVSVEYPNGIIVKSRYYNIDGGYLKTEKKKFGAPVYHNSEDNVYLYRLENEWAIAPTISNYYIYLKSSLVFKNEPPQEANWRKAGISLYECDPIFEKDEEENEIESFCDKEFDAVPSSIDIPEFNNASWIRAPKLHEKNSVMKLFNMIEPNDIIQGSVGSCWLLCALSALAEFPAFFERKVFITKEINDEGKYEMNFYNPSNRKWEIQTVDDRIPCTKGSWFRKSSPLFAKPHENEMYILLLEKAFAKIAGSYQKISGGYPVLAWLILTGCEELYIWTKKNALWNKNIVNVSRNSQIDFQKLYVNRTGVRFENDRFFSTLKECDNKNYVMGASIHGNEMEKKRNDGLVERHAYSLIEVYDNLENNIQLVCLRNPWGNEMEWNGDWSDESNLWQKYPHIKEELNFEKKPDGLFWMSSTDFFKIFDDVQVCCKSMDTPRAKFADEIDNIEEV